MTAAIVIEVSPSQPAVPFAEGMIQGCTVAAKGQWQCVLADDAKADDRTAIAIVAWSDRPNVHAHVEVGQRTGAAGTWRARDLAFSASDPEIERWRAVGFAIATLMGDSPVHAGASATPPSSQPAATASPATKETTVPRPLMPNAWSVDGRVVLSVGISASTEVPGAEVRVERTLGRGPWLVTAALRGSLEHAETFSIAHFGADGGFGIASSGSSPLRVGAHVEPTLEVVSANGAEPNSTEPGNAQRVRLGLRQGADLAWMASESWGIVAGAAICEWSGTTFVTAHTRPVTTLPMVQTEGSVGVRLSLP